MVYTAATGTLLWQRGYDGVFGGWADQANTVGVSPDGAHVFVTGQSLNVSNFEYATITHRAG